MRARTSSRVHTRPPALCHHRRRARAHFCLRLRDAVAERVRVRVRVRVAVALRVRVGEPVRDGVGRPLDEPVAVAEGTREREAGAVAAAVRERVPVGVPVRADDCVLDAEPDDEGVPDGDAEPDDDGVPDGDAEPDDDSVPVDDNVPVDEELPLPEAVPVACDDGVPVVDDEGDAVPVPVPEPDAEPVPVPDAEPVPVLVAAAVDVAVALPVVAGVGDKVGGAVGAAERDRMEMLSSVREAVGDVVGAPLFWLESGVGAEPREGVPLADDCGERGGGGETLSTPTQPVLALGEAVRSTGGASVDEAEAGESLPAGSPDGDGGDVGAAERDRMEMPSSVREAVGDTGAPSFWLGSGLSAEPMVGVPLADDCGERGGGGETLSTHTKPVGEAVRSTGGS